MGHIALNADGILCALCPGRWRWLITSTAGLGIARRSMFWSLSRCKVAAHKRDIQNVNHAIPSWRRGDVGNGTIRIVSHHLTKTVHDNAKIGLVHIAVLIEARVASTYAEHYC